MKQLLLSISLIISTLGFAQVQLYVNNGDLGSFVNPTSDQDTTIIFDDINIPESLLGSNDSVSITRITFGLGRTQGAEAAKLKFYYAPFNLNFTSLENVCDFPPTYFAELDIPKNEDPGAAYYYTIGDGTTPLFNLKVEPETLLDDALTFFLGVSIDKKIKVTFGGLIRRGSGWSLTSAGQSPWVDSAWAFSPRLNTGGLFTVVDQDGNPFPQTYNVSVEGIPFSILPVTITQFSGAVKNNNAILQWETATETNNKGFDIERSLDGKTFTKVGFVQGNGTTTLKKSYTYTDFKVNELNKSIVFYRLRQVDNDGKYHHSKTIPLSITKIVNWAVYPNPANSQTAIQLSLENAAHVQVQIVNSQGQIVKSINKGFLQEGSYTIPLAMQDLANGVYMVKLLAGEDIFTTKLIK